MRFVCWCRTVIFDDGLTPTMATNTGGEPAAGLAGRAVRLSRARAGWCRLRYRSVAVRRYRATMGRRADGIASSLFFSPPVPPYGKFLPVQSGKRAVACSGRASCSGLLALVLEVLPARARPSKGIPNYNSTACAMDAPTKPPLYVPDRARSAL